MKQVSQAPRLLVKYRDEVAPELVKQLKRRNVWAAPRLVKVVINRGVGQGASDIKVLESAVKELAMMTGQKPVITRAKKSIANFRIRQGDPVGCKVTLRGHRMYEFMDRLIHVALPRIRDFRGISPDSFDQQGNYSLGLSEQTVFPEIEYDKVQKVQGMDIIIETTAHSPEDGRALLRALGMPFRDK